MSLAPFNFLCAESLQICNLGEEKAPIGIWIYWNTMCTVEGADPRFPTNLAELCHLKCWAPGGKKRPVWLPLTVLVVFYESELAVGCCHHGGVKSCKTQVVEHLLDPDAHQMGEDSTTPVLDFCLNKIASWLHSGSDNPHWHFFLGIVWQIWNINFSEKIGISWNTAEAILFLQAQGFQNKKINWNEWRNYFY